MLGFDLAFISFACAVLVVIHSGLPVPPESRSLARLTIPLFVLGLAGSLFMLRRTGSVPVAARYAIGTVFVVLAVSTAFHGGVDSPVLSLWVMVPVVAGVLSGARSAVFWAATIPVFLLGLLQAERSGLFEPTPVAAGTYLSSLLANLFIACGAAAAAVVLYERINAGLRRDLEAERRRFRYEAGHDPLTGLPNRRLFEQLQENALRRAARTKQRVALLVIDLDTFKPINDALGHAAGDRVLTSVAERLRQITRTTDSIARLGGDEFAVLVELLDSGRDAVTFANRLQERLGDTAVIDGAPGVQTSASIGIALYPDHGQTIAELHEAADSAMYAAKEAGGGCFRMSEDPSASPG